MLAVQNGGVNRRVGRVGDRHVMGDDHHVAAVLEEPNGRRRRRILGTRRLQLQVIRDDHAPVAEILGHLDYGTVRCPTMTNSTWAAIAARKSLDGSAAAYIPA